MVLNILFVTVFLVGHVSSFWDKGTTTVRGERTDTTPRTSFFRWQWIESTNMKFWFWSYDWHEIENRLRLVRVAGISIDLIALSTGAILNRRSVITAYNFIDPYINRQTEMRVWALGRTGLHNTPYRYRVWSASRLVTLSSNPEHCHGARCSHQPRHDVAIIIVQDQMYLYNYAPYRYLYAYRAFIVQKRYVLNQWNLWMAGSGYEYMQHIHENYKIFYWAFDPPNEIVDCSKYTVKHWGKFICLKNRLSFPGVQNGGPLFSGDENVVGIGCFEIRYNEDRIFVFTDLRYYRTRIYFYADLYPGQYYEYAYPQWIVTSGLMYDGHGVTKTLPARQLFQDIYPLGRK